ncbi:beta-alanine-activating enzyme [Contarinia nasturtii]|uniref:beta-alanine-activating enzyme n=1 Tax=Contarinia nasturtii TaxID=265458 RepID=UPI0012D48EB4|nr:beta-alanine-activating enzyme [Contarinia nasturtii]
MFDLSNIQKRGDNNVLKFFETADSLHVYSYADLHRDSIKVLKILEEYVGNTANQTKLNEQHFNVGILLPVHSPAILPIIVGIENAGCASCFLDSTENWTNLKKRLIDLETNIILCDLQYLNKLNIEEEQIISRLTIFNTNCGLIHFKDLQCIPKTLSNRHYDKTMSSQILFYATTSGSCGQVKSIGVTYKCFMPNITSLGKIYRVTGDDVIFVTSPPTFDPFMVDICLALHYGASLIMATNSLRCDVGQLLDVLFPIEKNSEVTIMQTTPSLFMRWSSSEIADRIFSSNSQLRILAFGGERIPETNQMKNWIDWENNNVLRIFNLYGLTEMSCWACVYEITKEDIRSNRRIPIGNSIDANTTIDINADGELLLKSSVRKCFQPQISDAQVIDDSFEFTLRTGDLVEADDYDASRLYFTSRLNSVIKLYGNKINLCDIEIRTKTVFGVEEAVCIHNEERNSIELFVKIEETADDIDIKQRIVKTLQAIGAHVKIYCVSHFPLTTHGKISKKCLLNTVVHTNGKQLRFEPIHFILQNIINECLGTKIAFSEVFVDSTESHKKLKTEIDSSFIQLGGTSLKAIQIVHEFEREISHTIPQVLAMLMDDSISIREILSHLIDANLASEKLGKVHNEIIPKIDERWKIDMIKCIDATPTVCFLNDMTIVSVGSHSKWLFNVSINDGKIISKLELPDRIESQGVQSNDCIIVGCYDGHLYCVNIQSGAIKWKFDSGAMIKCRALLIDTFVIFGNYNDSKNLWCLDIENGTSVWSCRIGTKSIYANPVKMNDENCLVCSLDGTVALVNIFSTKMLWTFNAEAPVFSTPSVFLRNSQHSQIILAAVNGTIYILNGNDGTVILCHKIDGNIFSSIEYFTNTIDKTCMNFVFGSQNHFLYCFKIDSNGVCTEEWKHRTTASVRSTPQFIETQFNSYICIFSSDGIFHVINSKTGGLFYKRKLDGDVFSTPAIHNQRLFVGSRNNFLYCIDLPDLF